MGLRLRQEGPSSLDWARPARREQGRAVRSRGRKPAQPRLPTPSLRISQPAAVRWRGLAWAARVAPCFFLTFIP